MKICRDGQDMCHPVPVTPKPDNEFCDVDELENFNHPKWNSWNFLRWKLGGGEEYLHEYKDSVISFHKDTIKNAAAFYSIPPDLLASVVWVEAGGMPDGVKPVVFNTRRFAATFPSWANDYLPTAVTNNPSNTSVGVAAMQIGVAAREIEPPIYRPSVIRQIDIKECLMQHVFNFNLVAKHLHGLILFDYPNADTLSLSDEQFILAGSRYNRGIERSKQDFLDSIKADVSNVNLREYSSYGRSMLRRREHIRALLR